MKKLIVQLQYLDKVRAEITAEKLPVLLNNNPNQRIGTCRVFRDENERCLGELELNNDVDNELYFYYTSLNTDDGTYWFSGLNLATDIYKEGIPTKLKDMIVR